MSTIVTLSGKCAAFLEKIVKVIAIGILVTLVCIVFFQVAHRGVTSKSFVEIEEMSIVLAAWVAFLTISYAARRKVHVRIEVFTEKLPFNMRNTLELLIYGAMLFACVLLVYHGYFLATRKAMIPMMVLPIRQSVQFYAYPVGMGLTSLFMFDNFIQTLWRYRTKEPYRSVDVLEDIDIAKIDGKEAAMIMGNREE